MHNKFIYIIYIFLALSLSSCDGPSCLDADDFGFERLTIPARYDSKDLIGGQQNQIAPWFSSNLKVNGDPLTIVVKNWQYTQDDIQNDNNSPNYVSAWCPWLSSSRDVDGKISDICLKLSVCTYAKGEMCNNPNISNMPCLLKKGIGLYALVSPNPTYDPNGNVVSMKNPSGTTFHLGEPVVGYQLYDVNDNGDFETAGGVVKIFSNSDQTKFALNPVPLYFKILDSYYEDNSGQYKIVIKSGVNTDHPDPIKFLQELVEKKLFGGKKKDGSSDDKGLVRIIFGNIISNSYYKISINSVLTIYIIITGLLFVIGSIEMTQTELISRVFKVVIISQLLTGTAYEFFYNNLFFLFIDGWNFLQSILDSAQATGPGGGTLVSMMLSVEIFEKLSSLLFIDWLGWLFIILYFILLIFVLVVFFQATIIILTAKLAIGMMIIVAPIFLCFMLFNFSRPIFDGWFKLLIAFTLQPLILYAGLTFISVMVRHEIYSTLGFKVCRYDIPNLGNMSKVLSTSHSGDISLFTWWFPQSIHRLAKTMAIIPVPEAHIDPKDSNHTCKPYECFEQRYPDLPFLDPNNASDLDRIKQFQAGDFVNFSGLIILFLTIYLLFQFNKFAVQIAMVITGDGGDFHLASAAKGFTNFMQDKYSSVKAQAWNQTVNVVKSLGSSGSTPRDQSITGLSLNNEEEKPSGSIADKLYSEQMATKSKLDSQALKENLKQSEPITNVEQLDKKYGLDLNVKAEEFTKYMKAGQKRQLVMDSYENTVNSMLSNNNVKKDIVGFVNDLDSLATSLNPQHDSKYHFANTKLLANHLVNSSDISNIEPYQLADIYSRIDVAKAHDPNNKEVQETFKKAQERISSSL